MPEAKKPVVKKPVAAVVKAKEAKEKKEPKPRAPAIKVDMAATYVSTGQYHPKASHNIKSLSEVEAVLPATYKEIQAAIPEHIDFVGYLIRRGGLATQA